jgi:uncharacterized membrane protein YjfL (UPF0719 family)
MFDQVHMTQLVWTLIYAALGLVLFGAFFWVVCKVSPFSIRKEIEEDQNVSLAVLIGAAILGISIIVAAAIH